MEIERSVASACFYDGIYPATQKNHTFTDFILMTSRLHQGCTTDSDHLDIAALLPSKKYRWADRPKVVPKPLRWQLSDFNTMIRSEVISSSPRSPGQHVTPPNAIVFTQMGLCESCTEPGEEEAGLLPTSAPIPKTRDLLSKRYWN